MTAPHWRPVDHLLGLSPCLQDQREKIESRNDVLIFNLPALANDLLTAGEVKLYASSDRTETDALNLDDDGPMYRKGLIAWRLFR